MAPKKSKGKCFLVGAGPGDLGLVTLRAKECVEQAEVIIYDYLCNPEMLKWAPESAELIYVGKKGRRAHPDAGRNQRALGREGAGGEAGGSVERRRPVRVRARWGGSASTGGRRCRLSLSCRELPRRSRGRPTRESRSRIAARIRTSPFLPATKIRRNRKRPLIFARWRNSAAPR